MKNFGLAVLFFSMFLAACEDPAANKAKALTSNASTPAANSQAATQAPANSENLAGRGENSKVLFTGSKVTGKEEGGFKKFNGSIDLVNGKPEDSSVHIDIDMSSVFTAADGLTKHLQSGDFFDVEKFPKASFASTKIVP